MADYKKMIPWIKKWEGGYANDPDDAGGCTMRGITIATYRHFFGNNKTCNDLKNITDTEWEFIFKTGFWDPWKADQIENQAIAEICVQMGWGSGVKTAIKKVQSTLGLTADGIVGPKTLARLNREDKEATFDKLWYMRFDWLLDIAQLRNNKKYLKGWLKRLSTMHFK